MQHRDSIPRLPNRNVERGNMTKEVRGRLIPLTLTVLVAAIDQATKALVIRNIRPGAIGFAFGGDLLRIVNVANTGVAFSMGAGLPDGVRKIIFAFLPLAVLAIVLAAYLKSTGLNTLARWCVCGLLGGGIGNLIDRFFRASGVVDFIDVKFFGLFGMERWPVFNVADSAVVVCGLTLLLSFVFEIKMEGKNG